MEYNNKDKILIAGTILTVLLGFICVCAYFYSTNEYEKKLNYIRQQIEYINNNVAFIVSSESDSKYHAVNCHFLRDADECKVCSVEDAEADGHKPCKACH